MEVHVVLGSDRHAIFGCGPESPARKRGQRLGIENRTDALNYSSIDYIALFVDRHLNNHVAFEAESRELVDACWEWVLGQGTATESPPKEFPHYVEGYYAVFFYDPDGIKLEIVHR